MLLISELERLLGEADWVVVSPSGERIDFEIAPDIGPATLLVRPVTDALKMRSGTRLIGAVRRDLVWSVEGFALNRVVVDKLGGEYTPLELYEAVRETRLSWQFHEL